MCVRDSHEQEITISICFFGPERRKRLRRGWWWWQKQQKNIKKKYKQQTKTNWYRLNSAYEHNWKLYYIYVQAIVISSSNICNNGQKATLFFLFFTVLYCLGQFTFFHSFVPFASFFSKFATYILIFIELQRH